MASGIVARSLQRCLLKVLYNLVCVDVFDGQVLHCSIGYKNARTRDECQPYGQLGSGNRAKAGQDERH